LVFANGTGHAGVAILGVFESDGTGGGSSVSRHADRIEMIFEQKSCKMNGRRDPAGD
jgi:hypothetical protein